MSKVAEAWSKSVGRKVDFETKVVEAHDGRKQTQLINNETGGLVVAVNATGSDAEEILIDQAGVPFIDQAFDILEIEGPNQGNQVNKYEDNVPAPSGLPGPAKEADKGKDPDKLAEDLKPEKSQKKKSQKKGK